MHSQSAASPDPQTHAKASSAQQEYSKPDVKCTFPEDIMGATEMLSQDGSGFSLMPLVKMTCFVSVPQMPAQETHF